MCLWYVFRICYFSIYLLTFHQNVIKTRSYSCHPRWAPLLDFFLLATKYSCAFFVITYYLYFMHIYIMYKLFLRMMHLLQFVMLHIIYWLMTIDKLKKSIATERYIHSKSRYHLLSRTHTNSSRKGHLRMFSFIPSIK